MFYRVEAANAITVSMARKFLPWQLRRCTVKHSETRNFKFNAPWPEKTKEHRLGANQHPLNQQPTTQLLRHNYMENEIILKYLYFFFATFHWLRNIPRQWIQNAKICFSSYAA